MHALVVDDNEANVYYLRALLEGSGWTVDGARHGAEALDKARELPPDVVISDLLMPIMDGYTLLKHWKSDGLLKGVPFVVYTSTYTEPEDERLALSLGADAFILKPSEPEDFLARLGEVKANIAAAVPALTGASPADEGAILEQYNRTLIRKLEKRTLQVEEANRALERQITEQRLAEARLRDSEALLRIAGRVGRFGGWTVHLGTSRVVWSDEVCTIHDVAPGFEPPLGEAIEFYAPEFRDTIQRCVESCARDGVPFDVELQIVTAKQRRVWVRAIGSAERDANGTITSLQGAFQDIDERKKLEAQFRQSQKMDAIGRLAGGVAHDFNNVLSVILSYSVMIIGDLKSGDPMRDDMEEIRKAGTRAAALTRQLLMFSRQQVVESRVLDINEVLTGMDKMLQRILGEDVDFRCLQNPSLGRVKMDPSGLEQLVLNLVVNARDAMPTGGKLTIETNNVDLDDDFVREHVGAAPGLHVMLAVSDTGIGMDRATQARIFEPFFTTKAKDKGTGIGLSTVYGVVQQSGGIVLVYSEPGKGTSFKVYLPRVDGALEKSSLNEALGNLRGTETILLVEDEDQVRLVASSILSKHGYRILEARNAGEALLLCESHSDEIHLLLTDVVMPQMSGPELVTRLAQSRPQMRVLCMSGYTDDSIVRHGVLQAEIAYLQKPITPQTLTRKVRDVLDGPKRASIPAGPSGPTR
jgi:signal transduction histidine kinase